MSLRRLGGETMIYGLSNVLGRLLNFVLVTPILTYNMASEEFGVVGILFFWTALLIALLVFRMDTVVFRFASRKENDAQGVFRKAQLLVVSTVVIVIGGMLLAAGSLADWLSYPDRTVYVQLVLLTVAFDALSAVPLARLRLEGRPWTFVLANLGNVVVNLVLIYLLFYQLVPRGSLFGIDFQREYLVGYYLFTIAAASALRYLFLLVDGFFSYRSKRTVEQNGKVPSLRTMLFYSAPLALVSVALIINSLVGPWLIQLYHGGSVTENLYYVGQFNAALKLAVFLNLFITAYNYAAEPFFFKQAGSDLAKADKQIYADSLRTFALVGTLGSAAILLFLPWLQVFLDEGERQGLYVLPMLLGANFLFGLYSNFAIAYKLTDKTYFGGVIAAIGSAIVVVLSIILMPQYGLWAPAFGMLCCYLVMCILAWLVSRRYFRVDYPLERILLYVMLAAGAVFLARTQDAIFVRGAIFVGLFVVFLAMEWRWLRRTFLGQP
ncbi:MAG: lipopolysaccharide biosynthesis protein [Bacteroidota bacterium]